MKFCIDFCDDKALHAGPKAKLDAIKIAKKDSYSYISFSCRGGG